MRLKQEIQFAIPDQNFMDWLPPGTFTPDPELLKISEILDGIPQALDLVTTDLLVNPDINPNSKMGRPGITVEQVLRTALLKQKKGYSYRELVERIDDSFSFRQFTRFGLAPIPNFSAL
ncbi:MAG: transposase [candidate division Zixibacteria bacterium]|nr:transposase [Candidatus Tariuqbacter arcticus]